eukprot:882181-Amorphochlora_amoeboformis.AAC.1
MVLWSVPLSLALGFPETSGSDSIYTNLAREAGILAASLAQCRVVATVSQGCSGSPMQASEPISSSLQIFSALAVTLSGHRSLAKVTMMDPSGGVLEPCAGCRVLKKREEYSNRQWKRRTTRFCKSCVNIQEKKLREVEKARKESRNPCHAPAPLQHAKSSEAKSDGSWKIQTYPTLSTTPHSSSVTSGEPFGGKFSIAELQTCIKVDFTG